MRHYNRQVKIYTRTGDTGETSLIDSSRVSKAAARVDAYGEVDELNACLGLVIGARVDPELADILVDIQRHLFSLGASLADPSAKIADQEKVGVCTADIKKLENWIDRLESELSPLTRFILPGGHPAAAAVHLARAVCRRAERRMVAIKHELRGAESIAYVNRLSDLLFVIARVINGRAGVVEEKW